MVSRPFQLHDLIRSLTRMVDRFHRGHDQPERLGDEVLIETDSRQSDLSLQIAFHDEAQRRKLARTVGDCVGHLRSGVVEQQGLEASEDAADSEIDFLARVRGFGLILIGRGERADSVPNVGRDEGGEVGSCSEGMKIIARV